MAIALVTIARDAADALPAMLESALPHVDQALIIDTGSVDDTRKIARRHGCKVLRRKWRNFAVNRTQLLREGANLGADYLLMLDADHTLHADGDRPGLDADSYMLRIRGNLEWRLPLLTRARHPFEYRGAAHSYLASDAPTRTENLDWLSIDGGPGASREKLDRDLPLLEAEFLDQPGNARTVFYLAQTHRFLGNIDQAIGYYRLRADMGGWQEETYYARYQLGCLLCEHVSFAQGAGELLRAWNQRRTRAEALRALANAANSVADKLDQPDDVLFVTPAAYRKAA